MNFKGKVILITGAGGGVGAETAHYLAKLGANVAIVDINENRLNEAAQQIIEAKLPEPLPIVADITQDPARIINETVNRFGRLDILVNNAGIILSDTVIKFDVNEFDRVINVNLRSAIVLTNLAVPHLERTKGNVVNVSSLCGLMACEAYLSYAISKAGLNHFTKCAAMDLASKGIRVNAVNPGILRTQLWSAVGVNDSVSDAFFDEMSNKMLVGRVGEVSDISSAIAYLASESFINGTLLSVDGGLLCGYKKSTEHSSILHKK